jgi:hypothetical protein
MARTNYVRSDDDAKDVYFVLDQQCLFVFFIVVTHWNISDQLPWFLAKQIPMSEWGLFQKRVVRIKFDIYVFIIVFGLTPLYDLTFELFSWLW